ncbi:MAG: carotenoid 1,2-hydratase [Burkholderiaceae bacterium]
MAGATALRFPFDFGAHPETRTEWWYVTGTLQAQARHYGFQVTFFRASTGLAASSPSRFAARQLVFAHAALTDLDARRQRHDQRIARSGFGVAQARIGDTGLRLHDWHLVREDRDRAAQSATTTTHRAATATAEVNANGTSTSPAARTGTPTVAAANSHTGLSPVPAPASNKQRPHSRYRTQIASASAGFRFDLVIDATQPLLLQGEAGLSRKGPRPEQTSRYYSEPQLAVRGTLTLDGRAAPVQGRAWLDHEWSDAFLDRDAVGWDWIGMNLDDGGALTAFRLRRADGSPLYAGGSFRPAGGAVRNFTSDEVHFTPLRLWQSPASQARYPVQWRIDTPAGRFGVAALLDDQELDSRASTGAIYWEGLSELRNAQGQRIGQGYLELTGYAGALRL